MSENIIHSCKTDLSFLYDLDEAWHSRSLEKEMIRYYNAYPEDYIGNKKAKAIPVLKHESKYYTRESYLVCGVYIEERKGAKK